MKPEPLPPPSELLALLQTRASFVLAVHKGPDGDAMGAALALYHALIAQGRDVQFVAPTTAARHYQWLPGADHLAQKLRRPAEVAILIDCDNLDRIGGLQADLQALPVLAQIDHHTGQPFGNPSYLDATAAASAVLVYRILKALDWPITAEIATCLYTGMVTDTGFFRFQNTSPEVLCTAAEMVAAGAPASRIADNVSEARPIPRWRLTGRALESLQSTADGRIVWAVLTPQDYAKTGTNAGDTEGIIDFLKQVEGQEVCAVLKAPDDELNWQVSLRAPRVDVAEVARQFGGGGHARASGFDAVGPYEQVLQSLLTVLTTALQELES